jgi:ATP-dependent helicase/DNAse subunit B
MFEKPVAWSYSALNAFENCGWRYYLTKIVKTVKEPQTKALADGNDMHKAFEKHIKGDTWMPDRFVHLTPVAEIVKNAPGTKEVERKFALNRSLQETTYFGADVWVRGQFDAVVRNEKAAVIVDWKNGKRKPDSDQLKLFAAAMFSLHPYLEAVHTAFVWIPDKKLDKETYSREEASGIWQEFLPRVRRLELAVAGNNFVKRPSGLCKGYCPVGRTNCEHWGE